MAQLVSVPYLYRIYLPILILIGIHFVWDYYNTNLGIIINNTDMDTPILVSWYI